MFEGLKELADKAKAWVNDKIVPWAKDHPGLAIPLVTGGVIAGLLWVGGHVIVTGVLSGGMMALGMGVILYKVKHSKISMLRTLYIKMVEHPLASDVAVTTLAFLCAPAGVTAWVAATVTGLLATCWFTTEYAHLEIQRGEDLRHAINVEACVA